MARYKVFQPSFGGKYAFSIDNETGKINSITYAQEYQVENTLYIRNWKLAQRISDTSVIADFDIQKSLRYKTMSYGTFESSVISQIKDFIDHTKAYYSMDQYSLTINNVELNNNEAVVYASHLTPHRLETKKLKVNTKYHSFYDEDIKITFVKAADIYRIKDVAIINEREILTTFFNPVFDIIY